MESNHGNPAESDGEGLGPDGSLTAAGRAKRLQRVIGASTLAAGAFMGLVAFTSYDLGSLAVPGAGLWPQFVAVGLAATGIAAMLEPPAVTEETADTVALQGSVARRVGIVFLTVLVYMLLLPMLGFLIISVVAAFVLAQNLQSKPGYRRSTIIGIATGVSIDFVFRSFLGVRLPSGVFEIGLTYSF